MKKTSNNLFSRSVSSNQDGVHNNLEGLVLKHIKSKYQKPYQKHNEQAFEQFSMRIQDGGFSKLILDSCCGTAMSSVQLSHQNPDALIVGIDQSIHRLNKQGSADVLPENCLLLQTNCEDFWRLCAENEIKFDEHYILYPNPWPKSNHLKRRWHGHPVFPVLKDISSTLELRSNWSVYLAEFARAWQLLTGKEYSVKSLNYQAPLTLFEKKYHQSQQDLFQLVIGE